MRRPPAAQRTLHAGLWGRQDVETGAEIAQYVQLQPASDANIRFPVKETESAEGTHQG